MVTQKPSERYVEDETERGPNYEQRRWEDDHLHSAVHQFGAKDARQKAKEKQKVNLYPSLVFFVFGLI